ATGRRSDRVSCRQWSPERWRAPIAGLRRPAPPTKPLRPRASPSRQSWKAVSLVIPLIEMVVARQPTGLSASGPFDVRTQEFQKSCVRGSAYLLGALIDQRLAVPNLDLFGAREFHGMRKNLGLFVVRAQRRQFGGQRTVRVEIADVVSGHRCHSFDHPQCSYTGS